MYIFFRCRFLVCISVAARYGSGVRPPIGVYFSSAVSGILIQFSRFFLVRFSGGVMFCSVPLPHFPEPVLPLSMFEFRVLLVSIRSFFLVVSEPPAGVGERSPRYPPPTPRVLHFCFPCFAFPGHLFSFAFSGGSVCIFVAFRSLFGFLYVPSFFLFLLSPFP